MINDIEVDPLLPEEEDGLAQGLSPPVKEEVVTRAKQDNFLVRQEMASDGVNPTTTMSMVEQEVDLSETPQDLINESLEEFAILAHKQAQLAVLEGAYVGDPNALENAINVIEAAADFRDEFVNEVGVQNALIHSQPPNIVELLQQEDQVEGVAWKLLEGIETEQDKGFFGKGADIIAFIAPDSFKDRFIDLDYNLFEDIHKYQYEMDNAERLEFWKVRVPEIVEAHDGNTWKAAGTIGLYMDYHMPEVMPVVEAGLDIFDLVGISGLYKGFKAYRAYKDSITLSAKYKKAGRVDDAAVASVVSGTSEGAAKTTGTTKVGAAQEASPIPAPFIGGIPSTSGIAARVDEIKRKIIGQYKEEAFGWVANKMPRGEEKALRSIKRDLEISKAKTEVELAGVTGKRAPKGKGTAYIKRIVKEKLVDVEGRLNAVTQQLELQKKYAVAEANVSRIQQGILPPNLQARVDAEVAERVKFREFKPANAADEAPASKVEVDEASPLSVETKGLSEEFQQELKDVTIDPLRQTAASVVRNAPSAISPSDKLRIQREVQDKIQAEAMDEGQVFANAQVVDRVDGTGFTMKYELDGTGQTYSHTWTRNDSGDWMSRMVGDNKGSNWANVSWLHQIFSSPEKLFANLNPELVKDLTYAGQQAKVMKNAINRAWKDAEKGLSNKELELVDNFLLSGDEWVVEGQRVGKVFTPAELLAGIETKSGLVRASDLGDPQEVLRSYYKKRAIYDELHNLVDTAARKELKQGGWKNLDYTASGSLKQLIARPVGSWKLPEGNKALIQDFSKKGLEKENLIPVGQVRESVEALKKEGYILVELRAPSFIKTGKNRKAKVEYGIINTNETNLTRLPNKVLNYQSGYIPRTYEKGYYFVKNKLGDTNETLFMFKTKKAADDYVARVKGEQGEAEGIDPYVVADKQLNGKDLVDETYNNYGGLYTGSRKRTPLMVKGEDGLERPDRLGVGEATERYLTNIANIMPINEYRGHAIQQWLNTVNKVASDMGLPRIKEFTDDLPFDDNTAAVFKQSRDYLMDTLRIATREERTSESLLKGMVNRMEGSPYLSTKNKQKLLKLDDLEFWAELKSRTFGLTMGWFNPRQVFIQSQNSLNAMAISPQHAPAAIADMLIHRTFIHMHPDNIKKAMKKSTFNYDEDTIEALLKFKESGLEDAILNTGDLASAKAGVAGNSFKRLKEVEQAGLIMYENGELVSRLLAFNIARRNLPKGATARELSDETMRMLTNMQLENAARHQKGVLGAATQFEQAFLKFAENAMPKLLGGLDNWSRAEKSRVLAAQMIMYGTGGVVIVNHILQEMAEASNMTVQQYEEKFPLISEQISEGLVGSLLLLGGAENMNASDGLSLLGMADDLLLVELSEGIIDLILQDPSMGADSPVEMVTGASANTVGRAANAVSSLVQNTKRFVAAPAPDAFVELMLNNADAVGRMTSTWNNFQKFRILELSGNFYDNRGNVVARKHNIGDLNPLGKILFSTGFQPDVVEAAYAFGDIEKNNAKEKSKFKKALLKAHNEYLIHGDEERHDLDKGLAVYSSTLSEMERAEISKQVFKSLVAPDKIDQTRKKLFKSGIKSPDLPQPAGASNITNPDKEQ